MFGMNKWLKEIVKAVVIAGLSAIVTNLVTGQPLAGLTKLKGVSQLLFRLAVPAWAFALVLFVALFGAYHLVARWVANRKGRVHFVADAHNSGWAQSDTQMEIRLGGTFTYQGSGSLTLLNGFLKHTKPVTDMIVQQETPGLSQPVRLRELDLDAHVPVRAYVNLRLTPVRAKRGETLKGRLVFRDKYNRDYTFIANLPYIGQR